MTPSEQTPSTTPVLTGTQALRAEITGRLKSRHTLLWVVTQEERRAEAIIVDAAAAARLPTLRWDCSAGLVELPSGKGRTTNGDPSAVLGIIRDSSERAVYVLRDFDPWLRDPTVLRSLRSRATELKDVNATEARTIVILSASPPSADVARDLGSAARVINVPLPGRPEIAELLDVVVANIGDPETKARVSASLVGSTRDAAIDAAIGLTRDQAEDCYCYVLATTRAIAPGAVAAQKRSVVDGIPGITWIEPDPRGRAAVGGLDLLWPWLEGREAASGARARAYGLKKPRGMVLVGVPGCGKSLTAKALPTAWGCPLIRFDIGAFKSKFVGESEANLRKGLAIVEAIGRCVVLIDEIEKGVGGGAAGGGGEQDGGVSSDALGTLLSWFQDRQGDAFVCATANDVSKLPPELLRKGRFDEIFFVDLPTQVERVAIVRANIREYKRDPEAFDVAAIAAACEGFAGSEVTSLMPEALYTAYADGEREPTTADMIAAAGLVVPLSKTAAEKIDALRAWAKGRARPASSQAGSKSGTGRTIDL